MAKHDYDELVSKLSKKIKELNKEIADYEKHKDDLEFELLRKDKRIEAYLKIINRLKSKSKIDFVDAELRLISLEDKVFNIEDNLDKYKKILLSVKNTVDEFLRRIYG